MNEHAGIDDQDEIDSGPEEIHALFRGARGGPLDPGVLRLLKHVINVANEHHTPVSVCGEIAGDARLAPLLLALGLTEFSLHPSTMLEVRKAIRDSDLSALKARTGKLMQARDRAGIEHWLKSVST